MDPSDTVGGPDLYAVLHVSRSATPADIKKAYRWLAQTCHPDKHSDPAMHAAAERNFNKIHEAYEVLSDPRQRQLYDDFGAAGVDAGRQLASQNQTPEEFRAQFARYMQREADLKLEARVNHRGLYSFSMSAVDALDPFDKYFEMPKLRRMTMQNSMIAPISQKDVVTVGGSMQVANSRGAGGMTLGVKRQCSAHASLEAQVDLGPAPGLVLVAFRELSQHSTATVEASVARDALGLALATSRQLSEFWVGKVTWVLGGMSGVNVGASRTSPTSRSNLELKVGVLPELTLDHTLAVSAKSNLRAAAKLGASGLTAELGATRKMSRHSAAGFSVAVGPPGIVWKFRFSRAGQKFVVPVLICPYLSRKTLLVSLVLPPTVFLLTKHLVLKPLSRSRKKQKALLLRQRHAQEVAVAMQNAAADVKLMEAAVERKRAAERAANGLLIERATFGDVDAAQRDLERQHQQQPGHGEGEGQGEEQCAAGEEQGAAGLSVEREGGWVDVTDALQFLVDSSELVLAEGVSYVDLMGFCDPCPGEKKRLRVAYSFGGNPYVVCVKDADELKLPRRAHRLPG